MKKSSGLCVFLFILAMICSIPAMAQTAKPDPTGLWLTENKRAAIRITNDASGLRGEIAWIIAGGMSKDTQNADASKRDRPLCGMVILWGFQQNAKNPKSWESGRIYKADDGDIYHANLSVVSDNKLYLRGYVGMPLLGKTQYWTRVSEKDYPRCK